MAKSFDEYCLFPMKTLRITQGCGVAIDGVAASTYSHKGQKAYDIAGIDGGKEPVYAPFSCKVMRIYNGSTTSSKCNFTWYANTKYVMCADGAIRAPGNLFFMTAHCDTDNMNKYGIKVGAVFAQGFICGYEGNATNVGTHCHIAFGEGTWDGKGWHSIGNGSYDINNSLFMHRICYLPKDCKVVNNYGYPWKVLDSESTIAQCEKELKQDTESNIVYFAKYNGSSGSISPALKYIGADNSYDYRCEIAKANGIEGYRGTTVQNSVMLDLLKNGKLVKPTSGAKYFVKYTGGSSSIVTALKTIGEDSTYSYRCRIAAENGVSGYKGTAAQNTQMLNLLKQGKLVKP